MSKRKKEKIMSYPGTAKKVDLVTLVDELRYEVPDNSQNAQLVDIVLKADAYNEGYTKNLLTWIIADGDEIDTRNTEESEKQAARKF